MRKNTLPAFHRCQQSAIMTSILYDLDSKKQIRYIADLLFHLCNISPSYNKVTVKGAAASHVFFHLKAEAVRMGEKMV